MTKDDQRVKETVQAELRRRRGALDRSEEGAAGRQASPGTHGTNAHGVRPQDAERRDPPRRQWSLRPPWDTAGE
jgi:hypothetical protein